VNAPTPERRQHDDIVLSPEQIADAYGCIGLPWRAETMLTRLQRNGDIGSPERLAGEEFHRLFRLAHLDPLRAAQMGQRAHDMGTTEKNHAGERAKRQVHAALNALGGQASPCGSCAWHVLGCELSVRDWALHQAWSGKRIPQQVAKGTLIGTLGVLAKHFA
jgi:hypothetical protein